MTNDEVLQSTQHLTGTPYVAAVKTYIAELTGRDRVVGPNDIVTKEYDLNRVHVVVDEASVISAITFG